MKAYPVCNCFCCPNGKIRINLNQETCFKFKHELFCEKSLKVTHMLQDHMMINSDVTPEWDQIPNFCGLLDIKDNE